MELESARRANLLVGNDEGAPVLELLLASEKFGVLNSSRVGHRRDGGRVRMAHMGEIFALKQAVNVFRDTSRGSLELPGGQGRFRGSEMVWKRECEVSGQALARPVQPGARFSSKNHASPS